MLPALEVTLWSYLNHTSINLFTQWAIGSWNSLSDEIVTANTIGAFKAKLDN